MSEDMGDSGFLMRGLLCFFGAVLFSALVAGLILWFFLGGK